LLIRATWWELKELRSLRVEGLIGVSGSARTHRMVSSSVPRL